MERDEQTLAFPRELVVSCGGFAIDIGGSVMKLVYRNKDDYDQAVKAEIGSKGTVRLVSFSRQELDEAIDFIKKKAYISREPGQHTTVYTTGLGGFQYKSKMEEALNVKTVTLDEGDCYNRGFLYLMKNLPRGDVIIPFQTEAAKLELDTFKNLYKPLLEALAKKSTKMKLSEEVTADIMSFRDFPPVSVNIVSLGGLYYKILGYADLDKVTADVLKGMHEPCDPSKPMAEQESGLFPVALGLMGSAFGLIRIASDGEFVAMELSHKGGRSCLAMAHLFLGCKNYEEFLDLARKGDSDNVDFGTRNFAEDSAAEVERSTQEDDIYKTVCETSQNNSNSLVFSFGQGVAKSFDDFKREDLAAALLRFYCNDIALIVDASLRRAAFSDVNHVFIAGGFPANEVAQEIITKDITKRIMQATLYGLGEVRPPYQIHFIKQGQHLGCLGALIYNTEQSE